MHYHYYRFLFLGLLVVLNSACGQFVHYEPGRKVQRTSSQNVTHHHVKMGETLYSIAFAHGRDHRDVARWNNIRKPYTIFPKQKLRVIPITSDRKKQKQFTKVEVRNNAARKQITSSNNKTDYVPNSKLRWLWPTKGKVVSTFSIRDPGRRGIDIVGRKGQPVKAAAAGRVVYRGSGLRGYGNLIILKHNETYFSAYAHTEDVVVKENEKVKLGQKLADMSNTSSDKTKLHFEIRRNGKPVNPMRYLPKRR